MDWSEIKKELERITGLRFDANIAIGPLPCGSYNLQEMNRKPVSDAILNVRVYSQDFEGLQTYKETLITGMNDTVIDTENLWLHSRFSNALITEDTERGWYDLSMQFLIKWKTKGKTNG